MENKMLIFNFNNLRRKTMFNFLIKISMVIMILCSNNLLAMEAYENDIRLSERSFLISDTFGEQAHIRHPNANKIILLFIFIN